MLRRAKRVRRLPLKYRDVGAERSPSNKDKVTFKCVRVGHSFRAKATPRRRSGKAHRVHCSPAISLACRYPVLKILRHAVSKAGVTKFLLQWAPPDDEQTLEPIENIHESPLMVKKYVLGEEMKFRRRLKVNGVKPDTNFQFPKLNSTISNKLNHPAESYIPGGFEKVSKILEEIDGGRGVKLWLVQFQGFEETHFVNKQRIVYYFPLNACLYVHDCWLYEKRNKKFASP